MCEVYACVYVCLILLEYMHVFMWICVCLYRVVHWTCVNTWDVFVFLYEILHVLCRHVNLCVYVWVCMKGCTTYQVLCVCVLVHKCTWVSMCMRMWCIHLCVSISVHSDLCVYTKPTSPSLKKACRLSHLRNCAINSSQDMWDAPVTLLSISKQPLQCSCIYLEKVPLLRWTLFVPVTCGPWTSCPVLGFKIAEHNFLCPQDNSRPVASHIHSQVNILWQASMGDQPEWSQLCHIPAHPDTRQNRNVCCHPRLWAANTSRLHQGALLCRGPQPFLACCSYLVPAFMSCMCWVSWNTQLNSEYWIFPNSENTNSSIFIKLQSLK